MPVGIFSRTNGNVNNYTTYINFVDNIYVKRYGERENRKFRDFYPIAKTHHATRIDKYDLEQSGDA